MTYEEREAKAKAARIERSDRRKALAHDLCAELEAVTGRAWTVEIRQDDESRTVPGEFVSARLTEAETGLSVWMNSAGWNEDDKAQFSLSVPSDPVTGSGRGFGSCPGVAYGSNAPSTKAAISRPAAAIAKQIGSKVLADWARDALAGLAKLDAAQVWRDAVAEAAGIAAHLSDYGSGVVWHNRGGDKWAEIESSRHYAGGKVTLVLPHDAERAAALVADLRQLVARYSNAGPR